MDLYSGDSRYSQERGQSPFRAVLSLVAFSPRVHRFRRCCRLIGLTGGGWGCCELRNVLEESEFRWIWIRGIRTIRSEAAVGLPLSPFRAVLSLAQFHQGGVNYESRELQEWDDSEELNCDAGPARKPFKTVRP